MTDNTGSNYVGISKAFSKISKILFAYEIANDFYQFATSCQRLPYNYYIGIDFYDSYGVDTFVGDYGYKEMYTSHTAVNKHSKNIINEYYDIGNHNYGYQLISGYSCEVVHNLQYSGSEYKNDIFFNW